MIAGTEASASTSTATNTATTTTGPVDLDSPSNGAAEATQPAQQPEVRREVPQQLDLAFLLDCTGSMGQYIESAKTNIHAIYSRLNQQEGVDLRLSLIAYRDHPPQDTSYVTRVFGFSGDVSVMSTNLNAMTAQGGGDGPEAVTAGLYEASNLDWRPNAAKIIVLIADAPPHGLGEAGDGFPNGDPDGHDPLVLAQQMSDRGIVIYSVGCEPALQQYRFARGFFLALARIGKGRAVTLASSHLLAEVILGSAIEELGLEAISDQVQEQVTNIREDIRTRLGREATESEVKESFKTFMKESKVRTRRMETDGLMVEDEACKAYIASPSLSAARDMLRTSAPSAPPAAPTRSVFAMRSMRPAPSDMVHLSAAPMHMASAPARVTESSSSATRCDVVTDELDEDMIERVYQKSKGKAERSRR